MGNPAFRSHLELYLITMTVISHIVMHRKIIGWVQVEQYAMRDALVRALVRVCGVYCNLRMTADKNIADHYRRQGLDKAKVRYLLSPP